MNVFAPSKKVTIDLKDLVSIDRKFRISTGTLELVSGQVYEFINRLALDGLTHTYIDTVRVRIEDGYLYINEDREQPCTLIGENDGTLIIETVYSNDPTYSIARFVLDKPTVSQLVRKCNKMISDHATWLSSVL